MSTDERRSDNAAASARSTHLQNATPNVVYATPPAGLEPIVAPRRKVIGGVNAGQVGEVMTGGNGVMLTLRTEAGRYFDVKREDTVPYGKSSRRDSMGYKPSTRVKFRLPDGFIARVNGCSVGASSTAEFEIEVTADGQRQLMNGKDRLGGLKLDIARSLSCDVMAAVENAVIRHEIVKVVANGAGLTGME